MTISHTEALAAYRRAADQATLPAPAAGALGGTGQKDFAAVLQTAVEDGIGTLRHAETQTLAAAAGKADINEVVMAMSQAEMTLQTVVTLRDRAVQAYQEILQMPI